MAEPRQLVHSQWFDHSLQRLGELRDVESVLAKELYRLACYADLVPFAPGSTSLRIYQSASLLRDDGSVVRALIYFVLRKDDTVELLHIETVDAGDVLNG